MRRIAYQRRGERHLDGDGAVGDDYLAVFRRHANGVLMILGDELQLVGQLGGHTFEKRQIGFVGAQHDELDDVVAVQKET